MKKIAALISILFMLSGCDNAHNISSSSTSQSDEVKNQSEHSGNNISGAPVKVSIEVMDVNDNNHYFNVLKIQSLENDLIVTNIELNRGNCQPNPFFNAPLPHSLKYGQTDAVILYPPDSNLCDLLETKITTNKGESTFKFD